MARILFADDDDLFRESAAAVLRTGGYEVVTAANSSDGNAALGAGAFDLLISDIVMAGNERLEWMARIATETPDLPVMLVTGHPCLGTAIEAVRLPIRAYLVKPITPQLLTSEVARCLEPEAVERRTRALLAASARAWDLTPREQNVLGALASGASNKQISQELGCAIRTVEVHVSAILRKARTTTRSELVAKFWQSA